MSDRKPRLVIADLRGGRNGYDPPWAIDDDECVDAVNIDWYQTRFANKAAGCSNVSTTFSAGGPFTAPLGTLFRHVPGTDETLAELWAIDTALVMGRMAGATTFAAPTLKDAMTGNGYDWAGASINGKLMQGYQSAVDRLHTWDTATVRRTGLAASAAPTAANTGAGAYAAILRYYRERSTRQVGGVTTGRSEPSASVSFTPSGAGTAARVTQAAAINEGETHWEIEASLDNVTFYRIATVVIGTTTYDDSAATTSYNTNPLSALTGTYTLQKSYKFIAADQNRLLGFGSYTAADKQNRIEISAVIGSLDIGDEERVDTTTNWFLDLDESDSGYPTGLAGPIFGSFFAFKDRQTWQLTPTGNVTAPYSQRAISKSIGALTHRSIVRGEDESGNPALYWMSHRGPYRWGVNGLQYLGRGVEDVVIGPTTRITISAVQLVSHAVYYADKRQVWWWFAILNNTAPTELIVFDVLTRGWSRFTSRQASRAQCSCMFSNTLGATMSHDLKPYLGQLDANATLWKADTGTDDAGTTFRAYVTTKAFEPGGPGFSGEVGDASLLAKAAAGVTITDTVTADFGLQTTSGTALLTASGAETRVTKRIEGSGLSGVAFVQHTIGDAAASTAAWTLDRLVVPFTRHEAGSA